MWHDSWCMYNLLGILMVRLDPLMVADLAQPTTAEGVAAKRQAAGLGSTCIQPCRTACRMPTFSYDSRHMHTWP